MKANAKINNAQKGLIHVAKAKLGLSDEEYRGALASYGGGAESSLDLDQDQFKAVMKYFEACGFQQLYKPRGDEEHRLEAGAAKAPDIRALPREKQGIMVLIGQTLTKLDKGWAYAAGIARRMKFAERLEWCSKEQLQAVMAALVYQQRKAAGGTQRRTA